jgi:2-polyprenyl-6-methoxyphenol hydroxylase-like FAD-dependent oxidoreductase
MTCRVIDELDAPVTTSKAAVVHSRTMEVFADMGVVDAVLARSREVHGFNAYSAGKRVAHVALDGVDSPYPFPYGISQHDTEMVLADYFSEQGGVVERGAKLEALEQDGTRVVATVARAGRDAERIESKWIVGCDGAHSAVRKQLGFSFEGAPYEERLIQADVRIAWPTPMPDDEILVFLHEDGVLATFPLFQDGRYRLIVLQPKGTPEPEPSLEAFQRFVDQRGPPGTKVSDPAWMIGFRIHHRRTSAYRKSRAFVAGDAAHIHSPVGGQGMNTGIQDAYNLAWKLALVTRGGGRDVLLDSYEAERMPVATALLGATDAAMRGLEVALGLKGSLATGLRNQLMSFATSLDVVKSKVQRTVSMLGVGYPKSPIVAQDRTPVWTAKLRSSNDDEKPSLADWAAFGDAPAPGQRAGDVSLSPPAPGRTCLFDLLHGTRHVLFLFDGAAATPEGYRNLERIGAQVRDRFGAWVDVHVVVPFANKPSELAWSGSVVCDGDGALHQRFGARSECAFLVRPDGYVAYRAQPADGDRLLVYLETILV